MLSLLRRFRRSPKSAPPRSFRPQLERLEDRLSPSGFEMLWMNVTYQPNREVTLSGGLFSMGGPVANQTVNLGGVVNGTATTNAMGMYSVTLPVSQLGQVTAASADGMSNTAQANLVSGIPTINPFMAMPQNNGYWMLYGQVTGAPAQGEVIQFEGIPAVAGLTCNVNADGSFVAVALIPNGQGGDVMAGAVDWWGDASNEVTTTVAV